MSARRRRKGTPWPARVLRLGLLACVALLVWTIVDVMRVDVAGLAETNPASTAIMRQRRREAEEKGRAFQPRQKWIAYERISPHLRRAVLIAEDDAFFSHDGLDWNEIKASAKKDLETGRFARGGSTITQQLAKNLWLSTERTPMRTVKEMLLALRLEHELSKRRIFELYLNVIEWGDGVYGAEAAARRWFGTSASALNARQSVRLAAVIINPRRYSPVEPPRRIERRIRMIASRMRRKGELTDADFREVRGLPPLEPEPAMPAAPPPEGAPAESDSGATAPAATPE